MQNTTANYKLEINKPSREFECKITIGNNIYNNDELVNLTLEHTQPQEGFSIGDTISQSLDLTLLNRGDIIYSTSQIKVEIGLKIGSTIEYILMGIFNIDDIEKTDYTTKFTAYDNMIKFETPYFSSLGDKPTLKQVVNELSKITGIEFIGSLPNYTVSKLEGFTCREVLSYVASICGGNAVITRDGKFTIKSLSEIKKSIDGNNYFDYKREEVKYKIGKISCQIDENNILYKGSTGTDSMELGFENPWVTETILNDVYNKLNGLSYLGYSMKWQGDLSLDPYDIVTVTDIKNVIRKIPILSQKISYTGGLTSEIGAKGETKNKNSFSNSGSIVNKVNRAIIEQAIIKEALIEKANIKEVEAVSIRTQILEAKTAKIEEAIIDVAHISDLNAINANIQNLIATDAKFNNALINKADITELNAVVGNINIINSELANIKTLLNGNLSSENIQAGGITSDKLTIANGFITNAMIANLDVSKINAGNISTNKFRIVSDNGGIEIVGATQQFKDKNNKVRIQMGQDAKGNFNFILRGEDGTTTLIDHTGIKEKAIADNLIKGNMVATDAIGEKQINYSSLIIGLNKDTNTQLIKASKVAIDFVGQSLEVAFNSLKNQADNAKLLIENHSTTIGVMQGQINTAINNTQIVKDGKTILLKDDYNRTVSKVDSINSTIGTHTTKINELTGNITSVDTKVNSVQRDLEGTKSTVSNHTNLIDGLNSKVSTQGSSIEQLKNQITLKVNSTELTTMKNDLIGKIDSIEIGGRNTLLNATGNLGNTNHWSNVVLDTNKKVEGCNSFKITRNNFANGNARYQGSQTIDLSRLSLKANDYITLSGWVYVDSSINLTGSSNEFAFRNYYNSSSSFEDLCVFKYTNVQKNTWTKFSVTSKVTKDSYKAGALLLSISANGLIYVSKLKLEKGSKATDFTLAPEDVDSAIGTKANKTDVYVKSEVYTKAQTDSAINIAKDSINLGVSQTYETKTNVTSKINTAKTEAVNTSKSYADNKKAEAIVQAGKDADSKVNSAKTELNNKIDLKASKTDVYTKSETYTKTETDSKIKVAKDEINLSVSNNYETKTNVENKLSNITTTLTNKIDGIQVGGTNIATETNKGVTGWGWGLQTGGKTITEVTENGIRCCKMVRDSVASTGWSFINYSRIGRNKYLPNRKYTVSFEVKSSVVTSFYVGLKEGNSSNPLTGDTKTGNTVANTWTKLSATITTLSTLPSSTSQVLYLNGMNSGTGVTYIFRNLVITEGTKATSWSPAPEDVQASIDLKAEKTDVYSKSEVYTKSQTDSAINVAKDSINLGVSQTYETKTNVTSKINTAKTEAVNSAVATSKSYADTKKAEAISTASTDATNKVNSAKTELNTAINKKANSTDVYTKTEVYTKAQTDSAIKVAKDSIELGVKNTYETKTNVENKITTAVNTVQVGGDNVLRNGNFVNGLNNWSVHDVLTTAGTSKSVTVENGDNVWKPSNKKVLVIRGTNTVGRYGVISSTMKLVPNTKYTISGYCAGHRVGNIQVNMRDVNASHANIFTQNITPATGGATLDKWHRFELTFTTTSRTDFALNLYSVNFSENGYVWFCDVQIQQGTKATAWTPCSADTDDSIDSKASKTDVYKKSETYTKSETDSAINVAKDSINLSVSNTYETKTNVTNKINSANTTTLNSAKSYADTKKTEAINSANSSTDTKLKSYSTTTQMNSAIQVAKDSITNTVSSTYAKKADVESTYATKSSLTQTANNITASFKATGGYNLIANSTGYNGTNLWSSTGATMGTAIYNHIGGATNKYMYLDNGTKTTESFAFSKRFKLKANTKYTLSGWFHNFTKCPNFDVFLLSSTTVAEDVTDTSYTNTQLLIKAQNTSGSWKKFSITFTTPTNVISGYLRIDNNGYNSSGTNSNRIHWSALMLNEGEEQPWTPHPDEVYNGSTIIDASGITINNGALTVKNNSGTTVLSGDSNGNLDITGTVKSQKGNMYVSLDYGGLTFQSAHNKEQLLRMETTAFTSNKDINGVDLNLAKQGEYISFNHINKENLNNGWSSSDGRYNFVDFWSKDTNLGSKTYKKGINVNSPMYVNKGLQLYSGTNFYADIDGSISWNNGTGTVSNLLGMYGDNGAVLGYKSGESFNARFLVTEDSHPGTGDNLISWGNYNFNGYTFHNANIVAKSLSVQGSKNCLQETKSYGARLINAYETAEYYFGDIGFGQINEEGVCYVDIDDVFLECVNTDAQYHVFTQIYNGKITSIERYKTYFIVKGEQNTEFSWELKAKRKGYEINRLDLPDIETQGDEIDIFSFENEIETDEEDLMKELTFELENLLLKEHEKDE